VCFSSDRRPSALYLADHHRSVHIQPLGNDTFSIAPASTWQQDTAKIYCPDKDSLFYNLELLAVMARYNKF
jgi:hypothetical protein